MSDASPGASSLTAEAVRGLPEGEAFRCRVRGTSMEPLLREGDEVVARRWRGGFPLHLGDLVVIEHEEAGLVVHRLLWRDGGGRMRTRGDGAGVMDAPVPQARVLGRVIELQRDGRDVAHGALARSAAWLRHFAAAATHRLKRRVELRLERGRDTTQRRGGPPRQ